MLWLGVSRWLDGLLLTLNELTELSRGCLGLDPKSVGGTAAKASFARSRYRIAHS